MIKSQSNALSNDVPCANNKVIGIYFCSLVCHFLPNYPN